MLLVEGVPPTKWGRDDPPEHRREVQEGSEPLPGPLPGRHRLGVLDPHIGLGEVGQSLPGSLLVRGGVNGLESGRDLPAVPVGDEPHPGARNRVDHTGLDRRLGPGRIDRLRRARRARHIPPRFAPVREVHPLRSACRSRLCCAGTGAHEPPLKEAPSSARGPDT